MESNPKVNNSEAEIQDQSEKDHDENLSDISEANVVEEKARSQTRGEKASKAFFDKHPGLEDEMRAMGAPMDPAQFKEEGFVFARGAEDGSVHVWATTPEYKEWQKNGGRGKKPKQYEDLEDRQQVEREIEEIGGAIPDKDTLDRMNETLGLNLSEQEIVSIGERLPRIISKLVKYEQHVMRELAEGYSNKIYSNILENALNEGNTDLSSEAYILDYLLREAIAAIFGQNDSPEKKIAEEILKKNNDTLIDGELIKQFKRRNTRAVPQAIEASIRKGKFPVGTIDEPNESARELIKKHFPLPDDLSFRIMRLALRGYEKIEADDEEKLDAYDHFFGISDNITHKIDDGRVWKIGSKFRVWGYDFPTRLDELSEGDDSNLYMRIKMIYERKIAELIERYNTETLQEEVDKVPQIEASRLLRSRELLKEDVNIGQYLSIKSIALDGELGEEIISQIRDDECEGISSSELARALFKDRVIDIDYHQILQDVFKRYLAKGCVPLSGQNREIVYLTEAFQTESFKENQAELGIDFEDPEIFDLAFEGFLNVIRTRNGETSEAADWYYDNIFVNNPEKFLAMVKSFRDNSKDRGTKGKLTRFLDRNPQAFADRARVEAERRLSEEIDAEHHSIKSSILRKATRGDVKKIIEEHKIAFIERMQDRQPEEVITFDGIGISDDPILDPEEQKRKEAPYDFGYDKARTLERWADYIKEMFPDCNLEWFVDFFPENEDQRFAETDTSDIPLSIWERSNSYFGFSFVYEGKRCVIAESMNLESAMYLWCGEPDEDFKELFDHSKSVTKRIIDDPRIAIVSHLDKEHFEDSLNLAYQKAFLFFRTGDKSIVNYNIFDPNNPKKAREDWREYQQLEFPAWPIGIDGFSQYPQDIERYREWQTKQEGEQERLRKAMEDGGPEAARRESERIARENAERLYNETLANT